MFDVQEYMSVAPYPTNSCIAMTFTVSNHGLEPSQTAVGGVPRVPQAYSADVLHENIPPKYD